MGHYPLLNKGFQGPEGSIGAQGYTGPAGPTGLSGSSGVQGPQGIRGETGENGIGIQGPQGFQGYQGYQGFQGLMGHGETGPQGRQGIQGSQGFQGRQGYQGVGGVDGANNLKWAFGGTVGSSTDPGTTFFTTNSNVPANITSLNISTVSLEANAVAWLQSLEDSFANGLAVVHIKITQSNNSSRFGLYQLGDFANNSSWYNFVLTPISAGANITGNCSISFVAFGINGQQGNDGVTGPTGTGVQGPQGFQGIWGVDGAMNLRWNWAGTGSSDPGAGNFYTDNTDLLSTFKLLTSSLADSVGDVYWWMYYQLSFAQAAGLGLGSLYVHLQKVDDPTIMGLGYAYHGTDYVSYQDFDIYFISGSGTFVPGEYAISMFYAANGNNGSPGLDGPQGYTGSNGPQGVTGADGIQGPQGPQGSQGIDGGISGRWFYGGTADLTGPSAFAYQFKTLTNSINAPGKIYIDSFSINGGDWPFFVYTDDIYDLYDWSRDLSFISISNTLHSEIYHVIGITYPSGLEYLALTVLPLSYHDGAFQENEPYTLSWFPGGARGPQGPGIGDTGAQGPQGPTVSLYDWNILSLSGSGASVSHTTIGGSKNVLVIDTIPGTNPPTSQNEASLEGSVSARITLSSNDTKSMTVFMGGTQSKHSNDFVPGFFIADSIQLRPVYPGPSGSYNGVHKIVKPKVGASFSYLYDPISASWRIVSPEPFGTGASGSLFTSHSLESDWT